MHVYSVIADYSRKAGNYPAASGKCLHALQTDASSLPGIRNKQIKCLSCDRALISADNFLHECHIVIRPETLWQVSFTNVSQFNQKKTHVHHGLGDGCLLRRL